MSGFGTERQRLAKESLKSFDCCSLTLQPCALPVITKEGYLFDKEAILQYIITKKNEFNRKMREFEKQKQSDVQELADIAAAENRVKLENFVKTEKNIKIGLNLPGPSTSSSSSLSNMTGDKKHNLPSFWVPSQTPDSGKAKMEKPDSTIYCPVSGKVLKVKDLIDVKFALANPNSTQPLVAQEHPYICAVTKDTLTNAVPLAVLRPTGDVVTMDCVEKVIRKDMIHPLTNQKLTDKDIIPLQRGGTGFASAGNSLEAQNKKPAQQC